MWDHIHQRSICWPREPTPTQVAAELYYIEALLESLPCEECKTHALEYFRTHPINLYQNMGYRFWGFNFHNSVNARLQKDILSFSDFEDLYRIDHIHQQLC